MKKITLLFSLFCLPFLGMAQDCNTFISTSTDEVTGKSLTSIKGPIVGKSETGKQLGISIIQGSTGSIIVAFRTNGMAGCVDQNSEINILFQDGSRASLNNVKDFNCDGEGVVYFGGVFRGKDLYKQLQTKAIKTIRFNGSKDYVQINLSEEDQKMLIGTLNCLDPFKKK